MLVTVGITANFAGFSKIVSWEWEYCILDRDLGAHLDSQRNMLVTVRVMANNACYGESYGKQSLVKQDCLLRVGVLHTGTRSRSSPGLSAKYACYSENYGKQCLLWWEICHTMLDTVRITAHNACYSESYSKQCLLRWALRQTMLVFSKNVF